MSRHPERTMNKIQSGDLFPGVFEGPNGTHHVFRWIGEDGFGMTGCGRTVDATLMIDIGETDINCKVCRKAIARAMGWSYAKGQRRLLLIRKNHRDKGLVPEERAELDRLQDEMSRYSRVVAPLVTSILDELRANIARVKARIARGKD
jgi:hypothetical protein